MTILYRGLHATFITEHPWPTVALVFLIGVVLPAVWSTHPQRRSAAMAVIYAVLNAVTAIAAVLRAAHRP